MSEDNAAFLEKVKAQRLAKTAKSDKYKDDSKDRLKKIGTGKIKTTMIGALSIIEKHFGFLWGLDENGRESDESLSPEEQHMKDLFLEKVRSEILDLGNAQIRNLTAEIQQYNVEWNRYHLQLPVRPEGPKE